MRKVYNQDEEVWDSMRSTERNQLKDNKRGDATHLKHQTAKNSVISVISVFEVIFCNLSNSFKCIQRFKRPDRVKVCVAFF